MSHEVSSRCVQSPFRWKMLKYFRAHDANLREEEEPQIKQRTADYHGCQPSLTGSGWAAQYLCVSGASVQRAGASRTLAWDGCARSHSHAHKRLVCVLTVHVSPVLHR